MARPDLLWAVSSLAREVTRWTAACDDRLLRLISYINCTKHFCLKCHGGDEPAAGQADRAHGDPQGRAEPALRREEPAEQHRVHPGGGGDRREGAGVETTQIH